MDLSGRLLEVRKAASISRMQLADLLREKGFDVKTYTICKWETGASKPTVEAFLAICEICRVRDIQLAFSGTRRLLRLYDTPVSAGLGNYLEDSSYELTEVEDGIAQSADYAVKVSGDSMLPAFADGQTVYIHEQSSLSEGETGVFFLNGDAYLKQLGNGCLISLNSKYAPIPINEYDDIKILGKVVG